MIQDAAVGVRRMACLWVFVAAVTCVGWLVGCQEPPPLPPSTYRQADLSTPAGISGETLTAIWDRGNLPDLSVHEGKKVAIVMFEVEFVTSEWEALPWKPMKKDEVEEKPEAKRARLETFREKTIAYPPGFPRKLTDEMYALLVAEMQKRGRVVLPAEAVRGSKVYAGLKTFDGSQTMIMDNAQRSDPDVGYPSGILVCPGGGLGLVYGTYKGPVEEAAIAMLKELDADVAAAVRIRVSVFRGSATIERGSKVWLLSRDAYGTGVMRRSLASDSSVLAREEFQVVYPDRINIDGDAFAAAIHKLFPTVIGLALQPTPPPVPQK